MSSYGEKATKPNTNHSTTYFLSSQWHSWGDLFVYYIEIVHNLHPSVWWLDICSLYIFGLWRPSVTSSVTKEICLKCFSWKARILKLHFTFFKQMECIFCVSNSEEVNSIENRRSFASKSFKKFIYPAILDPCNTILFYYDHVKRWRGKSTSSRREADSIK